MNENTVTYEKLCSIENLELAFKKARKGKTLKHYVIDFENSLEENLNQLRFELITQTYKPKPLETFILRDPKTRKISKSDFRDRVIHHAICNIIEDSFEKTFIQDSYANRIGKGGLNAIKRFDQFKKIVSNNNSRTCYILKADIKHYFPTVDHKILLQFLKRKIKDKNIIWLIEKVLNNYDSKIQGKGMPLGNLTSQLFANIYLNELDQYIKHELRVKYYVRYVDDFILMNNKKTFLRTCEKKINTFLNQKLLLELHPEKTRILTLNKGVNFLGFKIFFYHKILQRKNKNKFKSKFKKTKQLYDIEKIDREKAIEVFEGHLAYVSNANTYKYRKELTKKFNEYFPLKNNLKIDSVKKHENFNQKIENTKFKYSTTKTLQLLKKGLNVKQIAEQRNIKVGTVWQHIHTLIEHHQLKLKEILPNSKVKLILKNIKSPNDKLKDIKERIKDEISYDEIACVVANIKGKQIKKSLTYFIQWYQKTNCYRKCYYNKKQRIICRNKFQIITTKVDLEFTQKEFLNFINEHTTICVLSEKEKKKSVSFKEFIKNKKKF